ncbi:MAG: flavin reductase family protein [Treponemataceae bacterium]
MKKNFGLKTVLYPMPVFIIGTYDENGIPNAMNAAWGGIADTEQINICLSAEHKTVKNFLKTGAFTVSMADVEHIAECDYLGMVSANDYPNKIEKIGFHAVKSEFVNAPVFDELKFVLECKVISYDEKTCRLLGSIENVSVDDSVLTPEGKIDVLKLNPITYDSINHKYIALGKIVGNAFSDGKQIQ